MIKIRSTGNLAKVLLTVVVLAGLVSCSSGSSNTTSSSSDNSGKPNIPTALIASVGNSQVPITWQPSAGAASYNVYTFTPSVGTSSLMNPVATTTGQYTKVGSTVNTIYTYTGAANGKIYAFAVTAVNSQGESGYSNTITTIPSPGGYQNGAPWPRFRQNAQSTGLSSSSAGSTTGALAWSYTTGNGVFSSPAVAADGTIYVGSDDSYLYAFNHDGSLQWTYQTTNSIASSPAIGTDGTVYVGSLDANLYAFH